MKRPLLFIRMTTFALLVSPFAHSATEIWSVDGFKNPESALYDSERDIVYVSNVDGEPNNKDGAGHISRMSKDGKMLEAEWVTGLNAPKGLVQHDNLLYVSDIDQLVSIDVDTGKIVRIWDAEGAKFLNDLAVDSNGRIYVSDMVTDSIYQLDDDTLTLWLQDEALQHPNGLSIDGNQLLVAPWGKELQDDFSTKVLGHMIAVDLTSKSITTLGSGKPVGNLDGLEPDGQGNWLVTDWVDGALYRIHADGQADMLMDLGQGSADLGILDGGAIALVPMMMDDKVTAISIR